MRFSSLLSIPAGADHRPGSWGCGVGAGKESSGKRRPRFGNRRHCRVDCCDRALWNAHGVRCIPARPRKNLHLQMNYKIIGADGRQYGPSTTAQLREWIAAGRANAQTMAQVVPDGHEGGTDWKPLGNFPEFADLTSSSGGAPPVMHAYDPRKSKLVAGVLGIFPGGPGGHPS